jgi:hypothetical protein
VQALLQAEQSGALNLLPAPHRMDTDGSVAVPRKWENMVKGSEAYREKSAMAKRGLIDDEIRRQRKS